MGAEEGLWAAPGARAEEVPEARRKPRVWWQQEGALRCVWFRGVLILPPVRVSPPILQGRGYLNQFEFQINNDFSACVYPMHYWGHAFTKKLFIIYPECKLS